MRLALLVVACFLFVARVDAESGSYLFVWAGDSAEKASDFLGVIDADPKSAGYGRIVASIPTGEAGSHPHHTELEMPPSGLLMANGFHAGRTWIFDLTKPLAPRIHGSFDDLGGFSHPHSFLRLANGRVLATFQYRAAPPWAAGMEHAPAAVETPKAEAATGGLVEIDERGQAIRSRSASDPAIADQRIYPYSVLPMPALDRALSTTTDMNPGNTLATSEWVQVWRLSDLELLRSFALPPGPRGDEHKFTGEPRLLPDGKSAYVHTFSCGLYLVDGLDLPTPRARFVHGFEGVECGVPVLAGRYWLQTVPDAHALVVLDVVDPAAPREASRVTFGDDEFPHWIAIDPTGRRVVLNSGGRGAGNRLFLVDFDPATGKVSIDPKFRDAGDLRPGIAMTGKSWPHGFTGKPTPHGTVFSR